MYANDPVSVGQLRNADLLVASETHRHRIFEPSRDLSMQLKQPLMAAARTLRQRLRPTHQPAVGLLSASHDLFMGLDQSQLTSLATYLDIQACPTGELLGRQNEPSDGLVIVLDAQIGVSIDGVPITVLDYGSHFGALPLLDGGDALNRASFDVLAPGRIAVVDKENFRTVLDRFPTIAISVYEMADSRRIYLAQHEACTTSQTLGQSTLAMLEYPVHLHV